MKFHNFVHTNVNVLEPKDFKVRLNGTYENFPFEKSNKSLQYNRNAWQEVLHEGVAATG